MSNVSATKPRLVVEAVVIRKCENCGDNRIRNGQLVPGPCPSCGHDCKTENRGVIYDTWETLKEWWGFK